MNTFCNEYKQIYFIICKFKMHIMEIYGGDKLFDPGK